MSYPSVVRNGTSSVVSVMEEAPNPGQDVTSILAQCVGEGSWSSLASVLAALDAAVLAALIAANSFVLLCVLASRAPPHGAPARAVGRSSRRFIGNLAAADALVGAVTVYFLVFRYACGARALASRNRWVCLTRMWLISNAHLTSAFSMAAIAVDRYVAVVHALRYREIMNYRTSRALLLSTWVLPVITSCPILLWNHWRAFQPCEPDWVIPVPLVAGVGALTHGSLLAVVGVTHYRIHRVASAVRRRSSLLWLRPSRSCSVSETPPPAFGVWTSQPPAPVSLSVPIHALAPGPSAPPAPCSHRCAATKSARTVLLVTGCYFFLWAPYMVVYIARVAGAAGFALDVAFSLSHTFANLNYLVNPFIYAWKNAEVRCAILTVCKRLVVTKQTAGESVLRISTIPVANVA